MEERWKAIPGYEGFYEVSNIGNVRSVSHYVKARYCNRLVKGKVIKPTVDTYGYYRVCLCKNGQIKNRLVHRLVAMAFLENPDNLPCINHIDENKQNNSINNLEYCTIRYNTAYNDGFMRRGKKRRKAVYQLLNGKIISCYDSATIASRLTNISHGNIVSCLTHHRKTAGGYSWIYKDV